MSQCFTVNLFVVSNKEMKTMQSLCVSQVFKLLTDLKEQRKDSGKNKHSTGQQNLNTIMYEVGTHPLVLPDVSLLHFHTTACSRFPLHFHTDAEVPVKDALQQAESRGRQRLPHHHDASQTHKVSEIPQRHICYHLCFYFEFKDYIKCTVFFRWTYIL